MDIYEAIEARRTIRKFQGPATEQQLMRIIVAGTKAPSGGNKQAWEFIIVDDPAIVEKIADRKYILNRGNKPRRVKVDQATEERAKGQKESFANASLVVVYNRKGAKADAWLCIENMVLAAVAEGLGTRIATFWGDAVKDIDNILRVFCKSCG